MYYSHMVRESFEHIEKHIDSTLAIATGSGPVGREGQGTGNNRAGASSGAAKRTARGNDVLQIRRKPPVSAEGKKKKDTPLRLPTLLGPLLT